MLMPKLQQRMQTISWKKFAPLLGMLIFPVLGALYAFVNRPNDQVYTILTSLDDSIPFVKYFALPYSIWIFYIYACLIYFFFKDVKVYYRSLITYTVCALVCYLIYMVFQTTVPRPFLTGDDPFTQIVRFIYNRDMPYNCFPSIHCFSSYMVMKALYTSNFRNRINQTLIYGMSITIILSTFFIKQHAVLDAASAFILAELVYRFAMRGEKAAKTAYNRSIGA